MKITIEIDELKKPVDEISEDKLEEETNNLPKNVVKLPKDEQVNHLGQNSQPLEYEVKEGDTMKSISEEFGISYGELSTYLLEKEGTTSIHAGQKIEIPRHFLDLSKAR
jgi:LysM repeat protein